MKCMNHPAMANDSKVVKIMRDGNLFPEYVEHGDYNLVVRGIVKTAIFAVLLGVVGTMTFMAKVNVDLPDLRRTKDHDKRLDESQSTFSASHGYGWQVQYENWINTSIDVDTDNKKKHLVCNCKRPQVQTKKVSLEPNKGYYSVMDVCPTMNGSGTLQFSLIHSFPISYATHLRRGESGPVRVSDTDTNYTNIYHYKPGKPISLTLPEVRSPFGNWGTFQCTEYRYTCGRGNYYNVENISFGATEAERQVQHPNYGAQLGECVSCCESKATFLERCTGDDGKTLLYEPTLYNVDGNKLHHSFNISGEVPINTKTAADQCWGSREVDNTRIDYQYQCNSPYYITGVKNPVTRYRPLNRPTAAPKESCVSCCASASIFATNGCPGDFSVCCATAPKRTYENVCKSKEYSPPKKLYTVSLTAADHFFQRYSADAGHIMEGKTELNLTDAEFEAQGGIEMDGMAWKREDFITNEEFKHGVTFETRNISVVKLCEAAETLVLSNKDAYLERVLTSPILMDKNTVTSLLKSRFNYMKTMTKSTFNVAFEQDTFRLDFEGLVSGWGKNLDHYLDRIHSKQIMAELDAFHGWLKKELLDKLLSSDYADVFLDGSSWDGSGSRKYFNMGVWYPDRVNYGRKDTSESNEKDHLSGVYHLNEDGKYVIYERDWWAPTLDQDAKSKQIPGAQWGSDQNNVYVAKCEGFNMDGIGWIQNYTGSKQCLSCCSSYEYFQEHCADISAYPGDSFQAGRGVTCPATTVVYKNEDSIDNSKGLRQGFPAKWRPILTKKEKDGDRKGGWNFLPYLPTYGQCYWGGKSPGANSPWKAAGLSYDTCVDTCASSKNGKCEDGGGDNSKSSGCSLGTDCTDCGVRYATVGRYPHSCSKFNIPPKSWQGPLNSEESAVVTPADCDVTDTTAIDCCKDEATFNKHCSDVQGISKLLSRKNQFRICCTTLDFTENMDELKEVGIQPPRHFGNLCGSKGSDELWTGMYPTRHARHFPLGKQIALFTTAMHRYQAYCAKHNLRSMPLYNGSSEQRPSPAWSEPHVKAWTTRLFDEWLTGDLYLPLTDRKEVPLEGQDYGKGRQICARLPSIVNWVSDCDCKLHPQCESLKVHKYTHFFGTRQILQENNISAPTRLACSYFRQLEVLSEDGIDSFHPHSDYTLKKTKRNPTSGVPKLSRLNLDFDVQLEGHTAVPKPYPLRRALEEAMVKEWHDGLEKKTEEDKVFRRYYDECGPFDCYYDEQRDKDFSYYWQAFILAFGGLATVLIAAVNGVVNGICSAVEKVSKLLNKEISFYKKDIYELQHSLQKRKKKINKEKPSGKK